MAKVLIVKRCLVVGCGNTLRGDDGLGPYIVQGLQSVTGPYGRNVRVMAVPQLDVTLASQMHEADAVIFVDARADHSKELVKIEQIEPAAGPVAPHYSSHIISMPMLLRIALDWYGAAPLCYAVMPKSYDFSIGESVSDRARIAAACARNKIIEILGQHMR